MIVRCPSFRAYFQPKWKRLRHRLLRQVSSFLHSFLCWVHGGSLFSSTVWWTVPWPVDGFFHKIVRFITLKIQLYIFYCNCYLCKNLHLNLKNVGKKMRNYCGYYIFPNLDIVVTRQTFPVQKFCWQSHTLVTPAQLSDNPLHKKRGGLWWNGCPPPPPLPTPPLIVKFKRGESSKTLHLQKLKKTLEGHPTLSQRQNHIFVTTSFHPLYRRVIRRP